MSSNKISVIGPVHNEEDNLSEFFGRVSDVLEGLDYEIIFINDGSKDKSIEKLKSIYESNKECVKIINFSKNFGKESAIYAGLKHATGDFTCIIDTDNQQDPIHIKTMYNILKNNEEVDAVCMKQVTKKKRFCQKMFYKLISKLSGTKFEAGASDFRMIRKSVKKAILELSEKNRFSKGIFNWIGFNTVYEKYTPKERKNGKSHYSFFGLVNYAISGIIDFSNKPLRLATYTGFLTSFSAFVYLIYIVIKTLVLGKDVPGYASTISIMLFLGGIQLLCIGIVGEYLGKTYIETKKRPIYIAKEKIGFDDDIL